MALTEIQIKAARPKDKRYLLRDDRGLYLEVMTSGNKHWRLRYWENGKERRMSLGEYPYVTLKQAREKRDEMIVLRAQGGSIRAQDAGALSFEELVKEWHTKQVLPKTPPYARKVFSIARRFLFPYIGDRPTNELTAPEILVALRVIEARGMHDTAHTALQICGQAMRYAIATGRAVRNPAADLQGALGPVIRKHNASITDPGKISGLLRAMEEFDGSVVVRSALWFSAYTFGRPGEIRRAEWTEVNLPAAEWRIPAEKMKMRRLHIVPLSTQAAEILKNLQPVTGRGRYVFPSIRSVTGTAPMSENTINAALRRLGFTQDEMTAHGFRSMASTNLNEQGWPPDIIERQLAHVEGNSVRAAYNYAEYLPERRKMMQAWADWLDGLK